MTSAPATAPAAGHSLSTLRRLIQYGLLFALVAVTATGLSGLLERLFPSGVLASSGDVAGLALSLAFTLIGGPLAAVLWWFTWKRLDDESERKSAEWGLYLTAMYAVSLIVFATSALGLAASFIGAPQSQWASPLANALVWAGVWAWHRWMWKHPDKPSSHLDDVRAFVGWAFGLFLGAGAGIAALSGLFDVAIRGLPLTAAVEPWWYPVLRSLVWAVGGAVIWWWHWFRDGGGRLQTGLVDVGMIAIGIFVAGLTALGGCGVVLFVLLRLAHDRHDALNDLLQPLAPAAAAALIGAVVWRYHRTASAQRSGETRRAGLLVTSAVALAAAASGVGVIVNALLTSAVSPLAGGATRTLLLGGISSLLVGGPVWWTAWKPTRPPQSADAIPPGRRVYLVAFFGVSAVVALITLLVIGYRLFEFLLGDVSGASFLDRVSAPLGLLVAAGLVAGYHFALWRRERGMLAAALPARARTIESVTLVMANDPDGPAPEAVARGITEATGGARVSTWLRADVGPGLLGTGPAYPAAPEVIEQVATALDGLAAQHVLVVLRPGAHPEVIPLLSERAVPGTTPRASLPADTTGQISHKS